jgi:CheY-like chemotaxis protein
LVAEDNHINQLFVRELLKHCGCTCDVANNGDEALTALDKNRYDLVLMDCQMPEMDGFTATREIRRRESSENAAHHLPILALTANALKGDRERCLEAGMDDYLTKPLQAAQLQAMLAKYLGMQPTASTS